MSERHPGGPGHGRQLVPVRRMRMRGRDEPHRASTPLELLFDLCFVVAVSQAGGRLAHAVENGHPVAGVIGYLVAFFGIWWAWMNFSWFASAYDTDDVPYRLLTFVQIAGALILAAGVPRAFDREDFSLVYAGYVVMRLAMVAQWLRAGRATSGAERRTALRYSAGVAACQVGWSALLFAPRHVRPWVVLVMACAELSVPVWAERHAVTTWHPRHIAERYGLFTLIVLGETILAATVAVQSAVDQHESVGNLLFVALGGLLIAFTVWWIYFAVPAHERLVSNREAFQWGYGHYLVFGSVAAIGAGLEVAVGWTAHAGHAAELTARGAAAAVTVPTAVFLFVVWLLHSRFHKRGIAEQLVLPVSAALVLACTMAGRWAVPLAGAVAVVTVAAGATLEARPARRGAGAGGPGGSG